MRRIREAHHLTINDLHDETKIPIGLIEAFEERALFDHPQFNRVYLRSFVRTYAQVVGVDSEHALDALEEALSGHYSGSLAVDYLGEAPKERAAPPAEERGPEPEAEEPGTPSRAAAPPPGEERRATPPPSEEGRPPPGEGRRATPPPSEEGRLPPGEERRAAAEPPDEKVEAEQRSTGEDAFVVEPPQAEETRPAQRPPSDRRREREPTERESEREAGSPPLISTSSGTAAAYEEQQEADEDWSIQSPPSGTRRTPRTARTRRDGPDRRWVIGGLLAVAVAVVAWILISVGGSNNGTSSPTATADTLQRTDTTTAQPAAVPAGPVEVPTLGDSMAVRIIAAQGKVDPIRVTVDDDLRRPYWIDQGDSMTFQPTQRIVIEELLENIDLKVEGITYPTDVRDAQGRIVITRDSVRSHFASLQRGP